MSVAVTGAVNGVPTTAEVANLGVSPQTIPYFPVGSETTLDIDTDGSGLHPTDHRVAFIGGNVSGRDHFPFSVEDVNAVDGGGPPFGNHTIFPFDLPVATALIWWARVKRWHLIIDVAYDEPVSDGMGGYVWAGVEVHAGAVLDFGIPTDTGASPPTTEAELVTFVANGGPTFSTQMIWNLGETESVVQDANPDFDITNYSDDNEDPSGIPFGFGLFFPLTPYWHDGNITFHVEFTAGSNDQTVSSAVGETDYPVLLNEDGLVVSDTTFAVPPSLFDYFTCGLRSTDPGTAGPGQIKFLQVSVDIQAKEYWPYANTDGDPVYATPTGAQLLDPLS